MAADCGISALVLTRGRPELLAACLGSFSAEPPDEILVGIDGEDPPTELALKAFPAVKVLRLPRSCRGEARNALAAAAGGRWLCFLDDDVTLPAGYFSRLRGLLKLNPGVSVFGGGQSLSPDSGYFEEAVYALLASPWGGGPFTERFSPVAGTRPAGPEKFILCNLTVDSLFLRARGLAFEGHLSSAEENLLLNRLAAAGARMLLSGDLNLIHRRRSGPPAFIRQVFTSGRGRGQITALSTKGFSLFTLLPPAALVCAAAAAVLAPDLLGAAACLHVTVSSGAALFSRARPEVKLAVLALFPALHTVYAAGWLSGLAEGLFCRVISGAKPRRCRCEGKPSAPPR
ncbi:MAG: glycosyltransferase [Elusimicrobiales bacterium]|nr:glycosyltransferase [Elusimicrobiales bacterium]